MRHDLHLARAMRARFGDKGSDAHVQTQALGALREHLGITCESETAAMIPLRERQGNVRPNPGRLTRCD